MKLSKGFWQTYKECPNDAVVPSHKLSIRAGLIQKSVAGIYNFLPIGLRVIKKIEKIIREEHDKSDCYELQMSVVTPSELWEESGRWSTFGSDMLRMIDGGGRHLCVSPTNEETVTDIFRKSIKSYKQLPLTLYQINTKFRDEIRPRYGLLRSREFIMKDAYSFHTNWGCMDEVYDKMYSVYENIFKRMGLKYIVVEADPGAMGSAQSKTHEFQVLAQSGEDKVISCVNPRCGYAANIEKAKTKRTDTDLDTKIIPLEKVSTPKTETIEEVVRFFNSKETHVLKSIAMTAIDGDKEEHILCQLLGDDELNELKLKAFLKCEHCVPMTDKTMEELGIPKGYIGPFENDKLRIIYDESVDFDASYVIGGMEEGTHYKGFVPKRDGNLKDPEVVDLRISRSGDTCIFCDDLVEEIRGIEVGHIFQLGDKYTKAMNVTVLDENGKAVAPYMGCYGMGVTRILSAAIEQDHDENGIVWPVEIAPYHVYFALIAKGEEIIGLGEEIYQELTEAGIEVLFDDRKAGAGFKFKDADLLGLPLRVLLGERDYKKDGLFEIKVRKTGEVHKVEKEKLIETIKKLLSEL